MSLTGVPNGNQWIEGGNIARVHANTPMSDGQTDRDGIIRAVYFVRAIPHGETHGKQPQGIVGSRRNPRRDRVALSYMLCENRLRRIPDRILALVTDVSDPQRRVSAHFPDAHRECHDLLGLAALALRIVVQPVLRQIDDDAHMWSGRQDVTAGNQQFLAGARQPGIDPGIDSNDFLGTQAVLARQIVQRVLVDGDDGLVFADTSSLSPDKVYVVACAGFAPASTRRLMSAAAAPPNPSCRINCFPIPCISPG